MTVFYEKNEPVHYSILDLIRDEIGKVKNKMPKIYDPIAQFLAISH